jgi:hypothetical protein
MWRNGNLRVGRRSGRDARCAGLSARYLGEEPPPPADLAAEFTDSHSSDIPRHPLVWLAIVSERKIHAPRRRRSFDPGVCSRPC